MRSTKLIFFFGTPHAGSHLLGKANVSLLEKLAKVAFLEIPKQLRLALQPQARELFRTNDEFLQIRESVATVNFYEQRPLAGLKELVVDKDSATTAYGDEENIPIYRDHRDLIRFRDADDDIYVQISQTVSVKLDLVTGDGTSSLKDTSETLDAYIQSLMIYDTAISLEPRTPDPGTLKWLWEDKTGFVNWTSQMKGIHWITGRPGSGKSVLMGELAAWCHQNFSKTHIVISYFVGNHSGSSESSAHNLLSRLLEHILRTRPDCLKTINHLYDEVVSKSHYELTGVQWSLDDLKNAVKQLLTNGPQSLNILLLIDAIDECTDISLQDTIDYLETLVAPSCNASAKICFSCRRVPGDRISILGRYAGFVLEDKNSFDIVTFISQKFETLDIDDFQDEFQQLKQEMIRKSDGIFLWVELVLQEVVSEFRAGSTVAELKTIIQQTPKDLNRLYESLIEKVDSRYQLEVLTMLSVILSANSPLSLAQFRHVMDFGTQNDQSYASSKHSSNDKMIERRIQNRCRGLIDFRTRNRDVTKIKGARASEEIFVLFIHRSVEDSLLHRSTMQLGPDTEPRLLGTEGSRVLALACLKYLRSDEARRMASEVPDRVDGDLKLQENYPFLHYAVTNWTKHVGELEKRSTSPVEEVHEFLFSQAGHWDAWRTLLKFIDPRHSARDVHRPITVAIKYGYTQLVRRELEPNMANLYELDNYQGYVDYERYIRLAAFEGHMSIIDFLLEAELPKSRRQSIIYGSAVQDAAAAGHLEIVKLLIDQGATLSVLTTRWGNVLNAATQSGNQDIVKTVIEKGYKILATSWYFNLSLLYVMDRDSNETSETDNADDSAPILQDLRFKRWLKRTKEMPKPANLELVSFESSLFSILGSENLETIKLIVSKDAETRDIMPGGFTFLLLAVLTGTIEAVKALVTNGADPTVESDDGETVFHAAAVNRSEDILKYLLTLGQDPNRPDHLGRTPFHVAALCGTRSKIQQLLIAGAQPTAVDDDNYTIYHYGAQGSHEAIDLPALRSPLSSTVHINSKTYDGLTPLHLAAEAGLLADILWVLNSGGSLHSLSNQQRTILHSAARNPFYDCEDILNFLLDKGLNIHATDDAGMTVLHYALYQPPPELSTRRRSTDTVHWSKNLKKPRPDACERKLRLLVERGADVHARDANGNTPLHLAAHREQRDLIEALLELGAGRDIADQDGMLPRDFAKDDGLRELLEPRLEKEGDGA